MADEFFINQFPSSLLTSDCLTSHSSGPWSPLPDHLDSAVSGDYFIIRERSGNLGNIWSSGDSTSLSSPPKMVIDTLPDLPAMPGDPGFAERAARFSSLRTRFGVNSNDSTEFGGTFGGGNFGKLVRVSSSPVLKTAGSTKNSGNSGLDRVENSISWENSSGSGGADNVSNRKRKLAPKGETTDQSHLPTNCNKVAEIEEGTNAKRRKTEENRGDESKKQSKSSEKPAEPAKDYIHVRARRGQATDSHSLAERVRREKISERMKLLQDLVPGCNKMTGKALMLDEIINYVQSLQRQVEFLCLKLAFVNPRLLQFNMDNAFSKDAIQPNSSPLPMYQVAHQNNTTNIGVPCSMDPLNSTLQNHAFQIPQRESECEGELQSIVEMGYARRGSGVSQ